MNQLTIMRGISGSGKTSWAEQKKSAADHDVVIVSADHYFEQKEGDCYQDKFEASELQEAHDYCFGLACAHMSEDVDEVIVDNTHSTFAELNPYRMMARQMGYTIRIVECHCRPHIAAKRSKLGADKAYIVGKQAERFERLPEFLDCPIEHIDSE